MNQDNLLLTIYIAAWGWHIVGMMFFIAGFTAFFFKNPVMTTVFIAVFVICEIVAYVRKSDLYSYTNKKEEDEDGKKG